MKNEPDPPLLPPGKAAASGLVWRGLRLCAGWALLLLGIVGLFLPVLQGLLFIVSGLALLSADVQWARALLARISKWRRKRQDSTPPNGSASPPNTPI
jgi:hypothetical protein